LKEIENILSSASSKEHMSDSRGKVKEPCKEKPCTNKDVLSFPSFERVPDGYHDQNDAYINGLKKSGSITQRTYMGLFVMILRVHASFLLNLCRLKKS